MCYSLSETSAVDLGDGVRSHGTPDTGAGRRTLGHGGDAVGRVLTGWGEGRITGDTETSLCQNNSREENWTNVKIPTVVEFFMYRKLIFTISRIE